MRLLLDENFPLSLFRRLRAEGIDCDHIIPMGLRGITDARIVELLETGDEEVVLLTQDTEFERMPLRQGRVLISRVPQNLQIERRVEVWLAAIKEFVETRPAGSRFEILAYGRIEHLAD